MEKGPQNRVLERRRHRLSQERTARRSRHIQENSQEKIPGGNPVDLLVEARTLKTPNTAAEHPNIIWLLFAERLGPGRSVVGHEYCAGGDLWQQIKRLDSMGVQTPALFALHVISGIGSALAFLHHGYWSTRPMDLPLVHCDIKPGNIFLRHSRHNSGMPTAVLADFGQACSNPIPPCGTPGYLSPEYLDPEKYSELGTPSDIYAYGVAMWELCVGLKVPEWEAGDDPKNVVLPNHLRGVKIQSFLQKCLAVEPESRNAMTEGDGQGSEYIEYFEDLVEEYSKTTMVKPEAWYNPDDALAPPESESESEEESEAGLTGDEAERSDDDAEMGEDEDTEMKDAEDDDGDDGDWVDNEEGIDEW